MSGDFVITGLFYKLNEHEHCFRKFLDIKRVESTSLAPDLMVVMMNPGSSYPIDNIDNNTKPSLAKHDRTQTQIMQVMSESGFEFARILNLSDLRTPNSDELRKFIKSDQGKLIPHSIFSEERSDDFQELFTSGVPVILAWGVHEDLRPLAVQALAKLTHEKILGYLKEGTSTAYYHPLPKKYADQQIWLKTIGYKLSQLNMA